MINLQLEDGEMDIVFNALLDQPARRVMAVIVKIQAQVTAQIPQPGQQPTGQASNAPANQAIVRDLQSLPPKRPIQ